MKIKDFIRGKLTNMNGLPYFYLALVYLGKIAHPSKSFKEELVENHSEIVLVNIKDYISKHGKDKMKGISDVMAFGVH